MRPRAESTPGAVPALAGVLRELSQCEAALMGTGRALPQAAIIALLDDDFREIGASGRSYSRADVIGVLDARQAAPPVESWEARDFDCRPLCGDTYLLTYTLRQDGPRVTHRSSVWRKSPGGWKILFHQGTVALAQDE
jgi:hypothetical protein